mgnify:CR=1 FL=1
MAEQTVLEGMAIRCDGRRDLTIRFGGYEGTISRAVRSSWPMWKRSDGWVTRDTDIFSRGISEVTPHPKSTKAPGIVRGIKEYGIFVELTPNLSGLAEWRGAVNVGDAVSVYIKSNNKNEQAAKNYWEKLKG